MTQHQWVRITICDNIPPREGRAVALAGREIAIFNLGDRFFATDNRCPHRAGPLSDGIVTGTSVVCPLHAWKIDLATGTVERPAGNESCVATYATRIDGDGVVAVALPLHASATGGTGSAVPTECTAPCASTAGEAA